MDGFPFCQMPIPRGRLTDRSSGVDGERTVTMSFPVGMLNGQDRASFASPLPTQTRFCNREARSIITGTQSLPLV